MNIRIVGSMKFYDEFVAAKALLESKGHSVVVPRADPVPEPIPAEIKLELMHEFNQELLESDAILVMNYTKDTRKNHIGVNTLMEIGMAFNRDKKVILLHESPEHCRHELEAIGCTLLKGEINNLE